MPIFSLIHTFCMTSKNPFRRNKKTAAYHINKSCSPFSRNKIDPVPSYTFVRTMSRSPDLCLNTALTFSDKSNGRACPNAALHLQWRNPSRIYTEFPLSYQVLRYNLKPLMIELIIYIDKILS